MSLNQQSLYNNLVKIAEEHGCEVVSLTYESSKMEFKCSKGHTRITSAKQFKKIPSGCRICNGDCPIEATNRFLINIEKLGGKVIGQYKGNNKKVECVCSLEHTCYPVPAKIQSGRGMCRKCKGNCPEEAEKNFVDNVNKLGGKVIGKYISKDKGVECKCVNGHTCFPRPGNLRNGQGMCTICATERWSNKAEKNFILNIENLGGKVIGKYEDTDTKVECICKNNHTCYPIPSGIRDGRGMCIKCAGQCPIEAEKNFIFSIGKLGGKVLGKYERSDTKVECECLNGHISFPTPNSIQQGIGICKTCVLEQTESKGEKITALALDKLNISYTKQYIHPNLHRLRFDFQFYHQNTMFFIEFDGVQHQKYHKYFHRTPEEFDKQRQRDLMKNYLVKNTEKYVLIRLDHEWTRMIDAVDNLSEYLEECIDNPQHKIYAAHKLYEWIHDDPIEESIKRYFNVKNVLK